MITKVCGLRDGKEIQETEKLGVDLIGFIFHLKSNRCIYELPSYLPSKSKRVGVFVNQTKKEVKMLADRFDLEYLELHGSESAGYCRTLKNEGYKIIKSFTLSRLKDFTKVREYEGLCDYYIFEKRNKEDIKDNEFNFKFLNTYQGKTPFMLGGGIGLNNIEQIKGYKHTMFAGYNLNGCFDKELKIDSTKTLKDFMCLAK